jgi:hypothetical protein
MAATPPAVVQCFLDDFDACIAHLRFPLRHRTVIRTTTLLERSSSRSAGARKIIPHAFGERSVLKLMYAAVIGAADRWRSLTVGEFEERQLRAIREELDRAHAERVRPVVRPNASASAVRYPARPGLDLDVLHDHSTGGHARRPAQVAVQLELAHSEEAFGDGSYR